MKTEAWLRSQRLRHPAASGGGEGFVAVVGALFCLGLLGPLVAAPAWPVLVWAALAYRRPAPYQAAAAVVLAAGCDMLSGAVVGVSLVPIGAALLAANAWAGGSGRRWDRGHLAFAATGLIGAFLAEALLGAVPGFGRIANSILLLIVVASLLAAAQAWRSRHSAVARGRFPIRRAEP